MFGALLGPRDRIIPALMLILCSRLVMNRVECPTRLVATFPVETDRKVTPRPNMLMTWPKLDLMCAWTLLVFKVATTSDVFHTRARTMWTEHCAMNAYRTCLP